MRPPRDLAKVRGTRDDLKMIQDIAQARCPYRFLLIFGYIDYDIFFL